MELVFFRLFGREVLVRYERGGYPNLPLVEMRNDSEGNWQLYVWRIEIILSLIRPRRTNKDGLQGGYVHERPKEPSET